MIGYPNVPIFNTLVFNAENHMKTQNLIVLSFLFLIQLSCSSDKSSEGPAAVPAPATRVATVDVYVAQEQLLENIINATGSLLPNESVQIAPERAGKLVQLYFDESSYVKEGQLLAKIDDEELKAQLNQLKVEESMAIREEARAEELRKIDAIPQDEFERLQNTREQIQARIKLAHVNM